MGYLAPEALRFEELDQRSDLFSLGVVLFEALTMQRLYANRNGMEGARAILNEPPPDLGEELEHAPDELVELMFSLLAKDPADRPATADDVARRLRAILREVEEGLPPVDVSSFLSVCATDAQGHL